MTQSERFIEAARQHAASEDEADFDKALKSLARGGVRPENLKKTSRTKKVSNDQQ